MYIVLVVYACYVTIGITQCCIFVYPTIMLDLSRYVYMVDSDTIYKPLIFCSVCHRLYRWDLQMLVTLSCFPIHEYWSFQEISRCLRTFRVITKLTFEFVFVDNLPKFAPPFGSWWYGSKWQIQRSEVNILLFNLCKRIEVCLMYVFDIVYTNYGHGQTCKIERGVLVENFK